MADPSEGKPKTDFEKCVNHIYRVVSSHVGLILLLVAYSFLGAAIFHALEGSHENEIKTNVTSAREKFLNLLWNDSSSGTNRRNWTWRISAALEEYEDIYKDAVENSVVVNNDVEDEWSFWGSMFYAGTVYTTIGYGHISPATHGGKIATMLYAAIGIPLCLIVLADLGKLFTRGIKFLWSFIRRCYYTGTCTKKRKTSPPPGQKDDETESESTDNVYEVDDEFNLPVLVAIIITIAYICAGAGMYRLWEEWHYLDAFYFIFISISTIGFGDILPAHPKYFIMSSLYVFIGLALVSMCINVIMVFFETTLDKAGQRMTRRLQQTVRIRLEAYDDEEDAKTETSTTKTETSTITN